MRRPTLNGTRVSLCALTAMLAGCGEAPSIFAARGASAHSITRLGWFLTSVAAVVIVVVTGLLLFALFHRRAPAGEDGRMEGEESESERRGRRGILIGTLLSTLVLLVALVWTLQVLVGYSEGLRRTDLTVRVTGYQFWWKIEYLDDAGRPDFVTANELHIPVGARVRLELEAGDVIHSFWVPELAGKTDLIPGQHNEMWISADRPGLYRGQCAEFCGAAHANMLIRVFAEDDDAFARWAATQRAEAVPDSAGFALFDARGCAACHTVRGTAARGAAGPDLTHVGGRTTIAAGILANTPTNAERWLARPDSVKPGTLMPATGLTDEELTGMTRYLESLR